MRAERVEVGHPGSFDKCDTPEAVADQLLDGWNGPVEQFRPVTDVVGPTGKLYSMRGLTIMCSVAGKPALAALSADE